MKPIVGFWMICEAILIFVIVPFFGIDLSVKAKAEMILLLTAFLTMICIGSYLMVGGQ